MTTWTWAIIVGLIVAGSVTALVLELTFREARPRHRADPESGRIDPHGPRWVAVGDPTDPADNHALWVDHWNREGDR